MASQASHSGTLMATSGRFRSNVTVATPSRAVTTSPCYAQADTDSRLAFASSAQRERGLDIWSGI